MTVYISVRIPENVADYVDKLVGKHGYSSRADVVNDALRDFFEKYPETKTMVKEA